MTAGVVTLLGVVGTLLVRVLCFVWSYFHYGGMLYHVSVLLSEIWMIAACMYF